MKMLCIGCGITDDGNCTMIYGRLHCVTCGFEADNICESNHMECPDCNSVYPDSDLEDGLCPYCGFSFHEILHD